MDKTPTETREVISRYPGLSLTTIGLEVPINRHQNHVHSTAAKGSHDMRNLLTITVHQEIEQIDRHRGRSERGASGYTVIRVRGGRAFTENSQTTAGAQPRVESK